MSKSREQLNEWLKEINIEGEVVLDIGVQDKPTNRLTKGMPEKYITTDIDSSWNPNEVFDICEDPPFYVTPFFTVIFCIEVLEHCWNPLKAIENISKMAKSGCRIYLSTPFINPHHDERDMLRYTNEWYQKVLPKYGIEIVQIKERKATVGLPHLQAFYQTEGLKYSKIRQQKDGPYTYPIGYYVIAKKI